MTTYTITLTISEARTSTRTIIIEADSPQAARLQLLALPGQQTEADDDGDIYFTNNAFDTDLYNWQLGEREVVEVEVDDPDNILSA
jgi:hypothetical protein